MEAMQSYAFSGNMRKLNNPLDRAYVLGIEDHGELVCEHRELNTALLLQDSVDIPDDLEEAIRLVSIIDYQVVAVPQMNYHAIL